MSESFDRPHALAVRFAQLLLSALGMKTMHEIDRRNATGPKDSCASHDFCDANMVMESAYIEIHGHSSLSDDGVNNDNTARWNAAWRYATNSGFIKLIEQAQVEQTQVQLHRTSTAQSRWRIVVTSPSGARALYCKGTFGSSEAASGWISRERLRERSPGCTLEVEPDILAVRDR